MWQVAVVLVGYATIIACMVLARPRADNNPDRKRHAAVVVMGDLGHSPRMNFHALSIAQCGWNVSLVGYEESELMQEVAGNGSISVYGLPPGAPRQGNFVVWAVRRVLSQHWQLWRTLASLPKVDVIMVQNPPSIPTLGIARLFTLLYGGKLIIDWHNLGYTILALKTNKKVAVTLYRLYEVIFGRIAYLHLSVSMRLGLALRSMGVNPKRIMPLYDRPFKTTALRESDVPKVRAQFASLAAKPQDKWVVTSTSYTPDEDLDMFLRGLELYDKDAKSGLNVIVTGKGPLKEEFLAKVAASKFKAVTVHTAWLSYEDYHKVLSVCDFGVSMHQSSSGWDLPMKAIDMYGAGIPVLSLGFPALDELVKDRKNGLVFKNAEGLARALLDVTRDAGFLHTLKQGALQESTNTWQEQWNEKLGPVFGLGQYPIADDSSSSDSD